MHDGTPTDSGSDPRDGEEAAVLADALITGRDTPMTPERFQIAAERVRLLERLASTRGYSHLFTGGRVEAISAAYDRLVEGPWTPAYGTAEAALAAWDGIAGQLCELFPRFARFVADHAERGHIVPRAENGRVVGEWARDAAPRGPPGSSVGLADAASPPADVSTPGRNGFGASLPASPGEPPSSARDDDSWKRSEDDKPARCPGQERKVDFCSPGWAEAVQGLFVAGDADRPDGGKPRDRPGHGHIPVEGPSPTLWASVLEPPAAASHPRDVGAMGETAVSPDAGDAP